MTTTTQSAMTGELRKVLKRLHYPLEVMLVCARWYSAYPLSFRHLEEMMKERGSSIAWHFDFLRPYPLRSTDQH